MERQTTATQERKIDACAASVSQLGAKLLALSWLAWYRWAEQMSATVIVKNDRCTGEYDMFDVRSVNLEGDVQSAVLSGPLFLEIGETLTLRLASGKEKIDLVAKVQSVAASDSLMTVRLVDLDKRSRTFLSQLKLPAQS